MRKMVALAALAAAMAGLSEEAVPLWSGGKVPRMAELKRLEGIEFSVIKRHEPAGPGYRFLVLDAPQLAAQLVPGQFVHVKVPALEAKIGRAHV